VTGADIRRYRKAISQTQIRFAERLGISQAALSMIEQGRTAISDEHLRRLTERFDAPEYRPAFREFLRKLEASRAESQAALDTPRSRYLTLTVWAWEEGIDLSRAMSPEQAVELMTIRTPDEPAIAFAMPKKSQFWAEGEVFAFERCAREDVRDGDVCMVQVRPPRARATRTMIGVAHSAPAKRGRSVQIEPVSPPGPIFPVEDESVIGVFRAVYRGRYLG